MQGPSRKCIFVHDELYLQGEDMVSSELVADEYMEQMPDEASRGSLPGEEMTQM